MKKLLALLLVASMVFAMAGAVAEEAASTPLVVATDTLSSKFNPLFADTQYDRDVVDLTQIHTLTTDRVGGIIFNAIEGETVSYNGTDYLYTGPANVSVERDEAADTTTYTIKLREDIKFSDGVPATIDDVIFYYYCVLDPAYNGSTTLNSYDIVGLKAYMTQVPEDALATVQPILADIKAAGADYELTGSESFTQEQYDFYWDKVADVWLEDVQGIVDYVVAKYADGYAQDTIGYSAEEVAANDGLKVALGMCMWGFGSVEEGVLTGTVTGETWNLAEGAYPTVEDYMVETFVAYEGDPVAYLETESATGTTLDAVDTAAISALAETVGVDTAAGVPNITGIKKIDNYTVAVTLNGYEAPAIYSVGDPYVLPAHYYGSEPMDVENNKFGHPFGDLSSCQAIMDKPMGAGPYKFMSYENRVVYMEANENFYKGAPIIANVQFKETNSVEVASAVQTGTADGGELNGTKANFEMLRSFNSNGELTGDVVTTYSVANLGYGYMGLNADTMNVAGEPGSEASKNLRKAFATVLAVARDTAYDSYYGDAAAVINYPISSTSWAAPQATDEGYRVAYSVDVNGNDIYTADMDKDAKYAAATEAAKGFLMAAGYAFDEATGMFTAAPEGAQMSYEVIIPGDGIGDHPSFAVLTDAKAMLATLGIEMKINDPSDSNVLWDALDAGTQNMWTAAWSSTIDPDMYQIYHSSNIAGLGGSDSNHYHVQSAELDQLILDARKSPDQAYRKELYKAALDELMDWAVEVPAYQRQNIIIASPQRIDTATVTGDVTTFWGWLSDIETMQMMTK